MLTNHDQQVQGICGTTLDYYKFIFQNFLEFYFEIKFIYLYAQKEFSLYISIHFHK